jgi:hypothetical protein
LAAPGSSLPSDNLGLRVTFFPAPLSPGKSNNWVGVSLGKFAGVCLDFFFDFIPEEVRLLVGEGISNLRNMLNEKAPLAKTELHRHVDAFKRQ